MDRDWTEQLLQRWSDLSPKVDMVGSQVSERIGRVALHLSRRQDEAFSHHGLNRGEVGVLYALRGIGPPHRLSPTQLSRILMLSSAGTTSRIDRLERRGLVTRRPDPDDRRGILVELTELGAELADAVVAVGAEASARMLSGLTTAELQALGHLLRKLQSSLEASWGSARA